MKATSEQQYIIDEIIKIIKMHKENYISINAYAGTGKTTTLKMLTNSLSNVKFLNLAFNKSVTLKANELFPSNVKNMTINGLAMYICGMSSKMKLDKVKTYKAIEIASMYNVTNYIAQAAINLVRDFCNSDFLTLDNPNYRPMLNGKGLAHGVDVAKEFMEDMKKGKVAPTFDFVLKMGQLFMHHGKCKIDFSKYDVLLIDEAQDTNPVSLEIAKMLKIETKIFIGDKYQQVYSFRKNINAMEKINPDYEFALTETFRFHIKIANYANAVITRWLGAGREITTKVPYEKNPVIDNKAILFRTNAGMIEGMDFLNTQNIKYKIKKDVDDIFSLSEDIILLKNGKKDEIKKNRYLKRFKSLKELTAYAKEIVDKELMKTIKFIHKNEKRIPGLKEMAIDSLKNSEGKDVYQLITGHSAKGLEWDSVTVADDFFTFDELLFLLDIKTMDDFKERLDTIDRKYIDEFNLLYVAMTRAKKILNIPKEYEHNLFSDDEKINSMVRERINKGEDMTKKMKIYNILVANSSMDKINKQTKAS